MIFHRRIIVSAVLAVSLNFLVPLSGWGAEKLRAGGTGAALGVIKLLAEAYRKRHGTLILVVPESLGSGGGIRAAGEGALDIGLSSRPLNDRERALHVRARPFARTPFILVTRAAQARVTRLTSAQVHAIFTGRQVNWGDGSSIRLILRPRGDSDTEILVRRFIPEGARALDPMRRRRGAAIASTDQSAVDLAERVVGAMTTSTLALIRSERRRVTPVIVDGVAPSLENLESGAYGIQKVLYVVTGAKPRPITRKFVKFVYSRHGARILRDAGCLPMSRPVDG